MLTVVEVAVDYSAELGVRHEIAVCPIEGRGESRDPGSEEHSAGFEDPPGFLQGCNPVRLLHQVVKRPEEKRSVDAGILQGDAAGVPDLRGHQVHFGGQHFFHMARHHIEQVNPVSLVRQPRCYTPGPPPTSATTAGGATRCRLMISVVRKNSKRFFRVSRSISSYNS